MLMKIVLHMRFHVNATFRSRFACLAVFALTKSKKKLKFNRHDFFVSSCPN